MNNESPLAYRYVPLCALLLLTLIGGMMTLPAAGAVSTDAELGVLRDGFEARRDAAFAALAGKPLKLAAKQPPLGPGRPLYTRGYTFSVTDFAMRACWLNEQLDVANAAVLENCRYYIEDHKAMVDRDSFYWSSDVMCRLVEFFGQKGSIAPGRLTQEVEDTIYEMMWRYVKDNSKIASADIQQSHTWYVEESENHHLQRVMTCWQFSKLLKDHPQYADRHYDDGKTAREHFAAWTAYAKEYLRERAKKGLFIEVASDNYNVTSLKNIYNFYDFSLIRY
jgi:hypothetical protein